MFTLRSSLRTAVRVADQLRLCSNLAPTLTIRAAYCHHRCSSSSSSSRGGAPGPSAAATAKAAQASLVFLYDAKGRVIGPKLKTEAEALAKKQGLLLIAADPAKFKHKYPPYVLQEPSAEAKEELEQQQLSTTAAGSSGKKEPFKVHDIKRIMINGTINEHDLTTKTKQIHRWVYEINEVKVLIRGGQKNLLESVASRMEKMLHDVRILQKIVKANDIKFTVSPDPKRLEYYAEQRQLLKSEHGQKGDNEEDQGDPVRLDDDEINQLVNEKLKKK